MKAEAHRDRFAGSGNQGCLNCQAIGAKGRGYLNTVTKRKNCEQFAAGPIEPGHDKILPNFVQVPGKQRPGHAMHGETARSKMEQWRRRIQIHLLPGGTIPYCGKTVCPWV